MDRTQATTRTDSIAGRRATVLTPEDVDGLHWRDVPGWDGALERILWHDASDVETCAGILALAPGMPHPRHAHSAAAHHLYVLSGSLHIGDVTLVRGGYAYIPAGADHGPESAGPEGCTLLFVVEPL